MGKSEKLNTCQRVLAGQPAEGSPKGDMSGSERGKPETLKGNREPRNPNRDHSTRYPPLRPADNLCLAVSHDSRRLRSSESESNLCGPEAVGLLGLRRPVRSVAKAQDSALLLRLEHIVKGFAHHRRIEIMLLLAKSPELSLQDIVGRLKIETKTASEHLRRLTAAGLVVNFRQDLQDQQDEGKKLFAAPQKDIFAGTHRGKMCFASELAEHVFTRCSERRGLQFDQERSQ
jgi:DNA-binding MarR family transcriptional regulator